MSGPTWSLTSMASCRKRHSRLIATKLTQSATARREVEMLQKTWELLDHLAAAAGDRAVFGKDDLAHSSARDERACLGAGGCRLVGAAGPGHGLPLAGCDLTGAGFALTRVVWPDPTKRLVEDLTLAEHLDEYLEVGSFEFLKELADSKEFGSVGR